MDGWREEWMDGWMGGVVGGEDEETGRQRWLSGVVQREAGESQESV